MSYDYSLFNAPGPGAMSEWPAEDPPPMGTVEELLARIRLVHPEAAWEESHGTWWGHSSPHPESAIEFQLTPDAQGLCRFLTARRITRDQVLALCRALGVVAVDDQTVELMRP